MVGSWFLGVGCWLWTVLVFGVVVFGVLGVVVVVPVVGVVVLGDDHGCPSLEIASLSRRPTNTQWL